jgi:hypothetical protein
MRPDIVLTVPHRCIDGVDDPGCDKNAYKFATHICKALRTRGCAVTLITSRAPHFVTREQCDLNRRVCRGCHMRDQIRDALERGGKTRKKYLFDIHTFPRINRAFKPDAEIVVMSGRSESMAKEFYAIMQTTKVRTVYYKAASVNDIVEEAITKYNVPAVLIEIVDHTSSLAPIINAIVRWCGL